MPRELKMIRYIHSSVTLFKQLAELRRAGKKAELATDKCEALIRDIKQFGCQCDSVTGKRTRNGELRIKNCIKYNLGGGYRLVTIRVDCHLFLCFAGSHDDTDQWIEHHRYDDLRPGNSLYRVEERVSPTYAAATNNCEDAILNDLEDGYDAGLMAQLDESQLKSIFKGLFMTQMK